MKVTSKSRHQVVWVLLFLAVVGAALRQFAPKPSLTRDMGNLLLVLWVPIIGNVVGWVIQKLRLGPKPTPDFEAGSIFIAHAQVLMRPLPAKQLPSNIPLAPGENRCALVVGPDAITARLPLPLSGWLAIDCAQSMPLQFLRPDLALPRLPDGTPFRVLVGQAILGEGHVLQQLVAASDAPGPISQPQ